MSRYPWLILLGLFILSFTAAPITADELRAYYTTVQAGEAFEKHSRTGPYADIAVDLDIGRLVFWRGFSYLPYWETLQGKWSMPEVVSRQGDGTDAMPDKHNRYSYVRMIEATDQQAIIHWRYMPDFESVSWDGIVDEYFYITADGKVTRTIRKGTSTIDEWHLPSSTITQVLLLSPDGVTEQSLDHPKPPTLTSQRVAGAPQKAATIGSPVAHFRFDEGLAEHRNITSEAVKAIDCQIAGHKSLWKAGVSGTALAFDGYHSAVVLSESDAPTPGSQLTLEAWIALGAYPFECAPIIQQAVWQASGYYFGVDSSGQLGFHAKIGDTWHDMIDRQTLDLRRWYHVAATFDKTAGTIALYIDGQMRVEKNVSHADLELAGGGVRIGLNTQAMPAVQQRHRIGKWPSMVGFDGLIDEVRFHDKALSADELARSYEQLKPTVEVVNEPDLMPRRFPANPQNRKADRFGAEYTKLTYYDTWDNMWRVSDHPDVVVNFDRSPVRFVFWRGLTHSIGLVSENGKWAGDQSSENYKEIGADQAEGCCEHMSDKQCRHAHVRIIENTDARVVVHWRYGMVDSRYIFPDVDKATGWGDWADEYWTIYPDAVGVRHLERGWIWADSWVETMFYSEPGTMPEDNIDLKAYTLVNLDGEEKTYSWKNGTPVCELDEPIISMINMKSEYHPFNIYAIGSSVETFSGRPRRSHFHWWNHYPISQIVSDGRGARFPDRAAHSSLVWGTPATNYLLYGLTDKPAATLLPLAHMWNTPPQILDAVGCIAEGYRPQQRAYHLTATASTVAWEVFATDRRPLINPCFVINNWPCRDVKARVSVQIEEEGQPDNLDVRQGVVLDTDGKPRLVLWMNMQSTEPTRIVLTAE